MRIKKSLKVLALALAVLLSFSSAAMAALPNNTIVFGNKAYDLSLLNDTTMVNEILAAFVANGNAFAYVGPTGTIVDANAQPVNASTWPAVTYKDAAKTEIPYDPGNGGPTATTATVTGITGTNGSVNVVLSAAPAVAPVQADFVLGTWDGANTGTVTVTNFTWTAATKTPAFTVTPVAAGATAVSFIYGVSYKSAATVWMATADTITVPAAIVTATLSSVAATNGTISAVLDVVPTVAPVAADFTFTKDGAALTVAGFTWTEATKTAAFTFTPVAATAAAQSVVIAGTYKSGTAVAAPAYTVAAAAPSLTVALNSASPAAASIPNTASNVPFATVDFTAGPVAVSITSVTVRRTGLSNDTAITAVRLYDGLTQVGGRGTLTNSQSVFDLSGSPIAVAANTTKTITIKGDTGAAVGEEIRLGVSAVTASANGTALTATGLPVAGNQLTTAALVAASATVTALGNTADVTIGGAGQTFASFSIANTSTTESMSFSSMLLTRSGASTDSDISAMTLYDGTTAVATASAFSGGKATLVFSTPLTISPSGTKVLTLKGDLAKNISSGANGSALLRIVASGDIGASGATTGAGISYTNGFPFTVTTLTYKLGALTVITNATSPAIDNQPVKGAENIVFSKFNFTETTGKEGLKIKGLTLTQATAGGNENTDVKNIKIFVGDAQYGTTVATLSGGLASFDFGSTPIAVAAGQTTTVVVKAGIAVNATTGETPKFNVAATSDVTLEGATSGNDLGTRVTFTVTPVAGVAQTIAAKGTLTVAVDPTNPAATNVTLGQTQVPFLVFNATASGEPVRVNTIMLTYASTNGGSATDLSNIRIYDGTTELASATAFSGTTVTLTPNLLINVGEKKTLTVKADVLNTATANKNHKISIAAGTDVSSTGQASTATITGSAGAAGNAMVVVAGGLTITAASDLAAQTKLVGDSNVTISKFIANANGSGEDVNITRMKLSVTSSLVYTDIENVRIYDGDTLCGSVLALTDAATDYAEVNLTTPITVAKNTSKVITVKVDIKANAAANNGTLEIKAAATDVSMVGVTSGATITHGAATITPAVVVTIATAATATVGAPSSQINAILVGDASLQSLFAFKYTSNQTTLNVNKFTFTVSTAPAKNAALYDLGVYDGSTLVSPVLPEIFDGDTSTGGTQLVFNLTTPVAVQALAANAKTFTLKAKVRTTVLAADDANGNTCQFATASVLASTAGGVQVDATNVITGNTLSIAKTNITTVALSATSPTGSVTSSAWTKLAAFDLTASANATAALRNISVYDARGTLNGITLSLVSENTGYTLATAAVTGGYADFDLATTGTTIGSTNLQSANSSANNGVTSTARTYSIYADATALSSGTVVRLDFSAATGHLMKFNGVTTDVATLTTALNSAVVGSTLTLTTSSSTSPQVANIEIYDTSGDGMIDRLDIKWVQDMDTTVKPNGNSILGTVAGVTGLAGAGTAGTWTDSKTYKLAVGTGLTAATAVNTTGSGITIPVVAGQAKNLTGLTNLAAAAPTLVDKAGPIVLATNAASKGYDLNTADGKVDRIDLKFSEAIALSSAVSSNANCQVIVTALTVDDGTGAQDIKAKMTSMAVSGTDVLRIELTNDVVGTGNITVTFAGNGTIKVKDTSLATNVASDMAATAITDAVAPVLRSIAITAGAAPGFGNDVADALALTFSEKVNTNFGTATAPTAAELDAIFLGGANGTTANPFTDGVYTANDLSAGAGGVTLTITTGTVKTAAIVSAQKFGTTASPAANDIEDAGNLTISGTQAVVTIP